MLLSLFLSLSFAADGLDCPTGMYAFSVEPGAQDVPLNTVVHVWMNDALNIDSIGLVEQVNSGDEAQKLTTVIRSREAGFIFYSSDDEFKKVPFSPNATVQLLQYSDLSSQKNLKSYKEPKVLLSFNTGSEIDDIPPQAPVFLDRNSNTFRAKSPTDDAVALKLTLASDEALTEPMRIWKKIPSTPQESISFSLTDNCTKYRRYDSQKKQDVPVTQAYLTNLQYGQLTAYDMAGNEAASEVFFFGGNQASEDQEISEEKDAVQEPKKRKRRWRR
ncbi:MAG: hypothetical protein CMK59_10190 [Proteobacteria bacterium]|nr:hypothetical protein [Pseudomonadota bacterium]